MPCLAAHDRDLKKDGPLGRYPLCALQPLSSWKQGPLSPEEGWEAGKGVKTPSKGGGGLCQGNTSNHTEAHKTSTPLPPPQAAHLQCKMTSSPERMGPCQNQVYDLLVSGVSHLVYHGLPSPLWSTQPFLHQFQPSHEAALSRFLLLHALWTCSSDAVSL